MNTDEGYPIIDTTTIDSWLYPTNYPVREYQLDICRKALFLNTLVCLPTGLGKTLIAAVVMYNYYRWFPSGKVIFMAPTRPLVNQQLQACCDIMCIPKEDTICLEGSTSGDKRVGLWKQHRIFFCTPQTAFNDLQELRLNPREIVCLVFDEAHKATINYAYTQFMSLLSNYSDRYRALALSATPGADMKRIQQVIQHLHISHIELRTDDDEEVTPYVFHKQIEILPAGQSPSWTPGIVEIPSSLQERMIAPFFTIDQLITQELQHLSETHLQTLSTHQLVRLMDITRLNNYLFKEVISDLYRRQEEFSPTIFQELQHACHVLERIIQYQHIYRHDGLETLYQTLLQQNEIKYQSLQTIIQKYLQNEQYYTNYLPKLYTLQHLLLQHFHCIPSSSSSLSSSPTGSSSIHQSSRVLIFAHLRQHVFAIKDTLLQLQHPNIRPHEFIGQSSTTMPSSLQGKNTKSSQSTTGSQYTGMSQQEQMQTLQSFREGKYNVLIATSIAEEGLDIAEVDLLVFLDSISSSIRLIQRIGRTGRKKAGRIVLISTNTNIQNNSSSSSSSKVLPIADVEQDNNEVDQNSKILHDDPNNKDEDEDEFHDIPDYGTQFPTQFNNKKNNNNNNRKSKSNPAMNDEEKIIHSYETMKKLQSMIQSGAYTLQFYEYSAPLFPHSLPKPLLKLQEMNSSSDYHHEMMSSNNNSSKSANTVVNHTQGNVRLPLQSFSDSIQQCNYSPILLPSKQSQVLSSMSGISQFPLSNSSSTHHNNSNSPVKSNGNKNESTKNENQNDQQPPMNNVDDLFKFDIVYNDDHYHRVSNKPSQIPLTSSSTSTKASSTTKSTAIDKISIANSSNSSNNSSKSSNQTKSASSASSSSVGGGSTKSSIRNYFVPTTSIVATILNEETNQNNNNNSHIYDIKNSSQQMRSSTTPTPVSKTIVPSLPSSSSNNSSSSGSGSTKASQSSTKFDKFLSLSAFQQDDFHYNDNDKNALVKSPQMQLLPSGSTASNTVSKTKSKTKSKVLFEDDFFNQLDEDSEVFVPPQPPQLPPQQLSVASSSVQDPSKAGVPPNTTLSIRGITSIRSQLKNIKKSKKQAELSSSSELLMLNASTPIDNISFNISHHNHTTLNESKIIMSKNKPSPIDPIVRDDFFQLDDDSDLYLLTSGFLSGSSSQPLKGHFTTTEETNQSNNKQEHNKSIINPQPTLTIPTSSSSSFSSTNPKASIISNNLCIHNNENTKSITATTSVSTTTRSTSSTTAMNAMAPPPKKMLLHTSAQARTNATACNLVPYKPPSPVKPIKTMLSSHHQNNNANAFTTVLKSNLSTGVKTLLGGGSKVQQESTILKTMISHNSNNIVVSNDQQDKTIHDTADRSISKPLTSNSNHMPNNNTNSIVTKVKLLTASPNKSPQQNMKLVHSASISKSINPKQSCFGEAHYCCICLEKGMFRFSAKRDQDIEDNQDDDDDEEKEGDNSLLIRCHGPCHSYVHPDCYFGSYSSSDPHMNTFLCEGCQVRKSSSTMIECQLCYQSTGLMKHIQPTHHKHHQMSSSSSLSTKPNLPPLLHPLCVIFVPELVLDIKTMRCINLSELSKERAGLLCRLCGKRGGGIIQCAYKECLQAFHIYCAYQSSSPSSSDATHVPMIICETKYKRKTPQIIADDDEDEDEDELHHELYCPNHTQCIPSYLQQRKAQLIASHNMTNTLSFSTPNKHLSNNCEMEEEDRAEDEDGKALLDTDEKQKKSTKRELEQVEYDRIEDLFIPKHLIKDGERTKKHQKEPIVERKRLRKTNNKCSNDVDEDDEVFGNKQNVERVQILAMKKIKLRKKFVSKFFDSEAGHSDREFTDDEHEHDQDEDEGNCDNESNLKQKQKQRQRQRQGEVSSAGEEDEEGEESDVLSGNFINDGMYTQASPLTPTTSTIKQVGKKFIRARLIKETKRKQETTEWATPSTTSTFPADDNEEDTNNNSTPKDSSNVSPPQQDDYAFYLQMNRVYDELYSPSPLIAKGRLQLKPSTHPFELSNNTPQSHDTSSVGQCINLVDTSFESHDTPAKASNNYAWNSSFSSTERKRPYREEEGDDNDDDPEGAWIGRKKKKDTHQKKNVVLQQQQQKGGNNKKPKLLQSYLPTATKHDNNMHNTNNRKEEIKKSMKRKPTIQPVTRNSDDEGVERGVKQKKKKQQTTKTNKRSIKDSIAIYSSDGNDDDEEDDGSSLGSFILEDDHTPSVHNSSSFDSASSDGDEDDDDFEGVHRRDGDSEDSMRYHHKKKPTLSPPQQQVQQSVQGKRRLVKTNAKVSSVVSSTSSSSATACATSTANKLRPNKPQQAVVTVLDDSFIDDEEEEEREKNMVNMRRNTLAPEQPVKQHFNNNSKQQMISKPSSVAHNNSSKPPLLTTAGLQKHNNNNATSRTMINSKTNSASSSKKKIIGEVVDLAADDDSMMMPTITALTRGINDENNHHHHNTTGHNHKAPLILSYGSHNNQHNNNKPSVYTTLSSSKPNNLPFSTSSSSTNHINNNNYSTLNNNKNSIYDTNIVDNKNNISVYDLMNDDPLVESQVPSDATHHYTTQQQHAIHQRLSSNHHHVLPFTTKQPPQQLKPASYPHTMQQQQQQKKSDQKVQQMMALLENDDEEENDFLW